MDADVRASYEAHLASSADAVIVVEEWRGERLAASGIFRSLDKAVGFADECEVTAYGRRRWSMIPTSATERMSTKEAVMRDAGYQKLWGWFGLSYASFCVMPRILMHEMPDEWQAKMAALLDEYDATFDTCKLPNCKVMAVRDGGKFASWPDWLLHYRRPELSRVDELRNKPCEGCGKLSHECPCVDELIAKTTV